MRNKETLKFITNNIKGSKKKVLILSIVQTLLGVLTVGFSFMLKPVINALEDKNNDLLIRSVIILASIAVVLIILQIFYRLYYEVSYIDIENRLKNNLFKTLNFMNTMNELIFTFLYSNVSWNFYKKLLNGM